MTDVVAIAFTPAPSNDSPNLNSSSNDHALRTFHSLIGLCFSALRRWNPATELALITTVDPGPHLRQYLDTLDTSILQTQFSHQPPHGFYPSFNASLFSIDAMAALADNYSTGDRLLILDPDVLCTRPLDSLFERIGPEGFVAYNTLFPKDQVSQGLTAALAGQLHRALDPTLITTPQYYGGELYGFTPSAWVKIAGDVETAWAFSLEQWRHGKPKFVTEEHLLNYAFRHTAMAEANEFIRRIWTAPSFRKVLTTDVELSLWHLPAEKQRGLAALGTHAMNPISWFWTANNSDWRRLAARQCGLQRRPVKRLARDLVGANVRRIENQFARIR